MARERTVVKGIVLRGVDTKESDRILTVLTAELGKVAVVERHHQTGRVAVGLLSDYGIKAGAIASSIAHDSHNLIVAGDNDADKYENITYEGYGPNGVAVIVETLTDNRNRTAGDVRHYFDKFGGNLGTNGCVSFLFNEKGVFVIEREGLDEDKVMEDALEAGAADFKADEEWHFPPVLLQ